jgi:hypothetical protein
MGVIISGVIFIKAMMMWQDMSGIKDIQISSGFAEPRDESVWLAVLGILGAAALSCGFVFWVSRKRNRR